VASPLRVGLQSSRIDYRLVPGGPLLEFVIDPKFDGEAVEAVIETKAGGKEMHF